MTTSGRLGTDLARRVRKLAELRTDEPVVLSVYVNLDPSEHPTPKDRAAQIESLIDRARSDAAKLGLSHHGERQLTDDIERVRQWAVSSMDADGAHGIAVFCCSENDVFEVFRLSGAVGPEVHVGHAASLESLTKSMPGDTWCVFLVNRRMDRILRGNHDRLIEVGTASDDVHGQHDQGGWSQARYQRSVEKDVDDHIRDACDRLFEASNRLPFDKLLVGCPRELWPRVEAKLHSYLTDVHVHRFDAEVEHEGPDEVLDRVRPYIEQEERRVEKALMDRLAEQLGRDDRAVSGLGPVLEALNASRVEVLVLTDAGAQAGVVCSACGWMGTDGSTCPADGTKLDRVENIADTATRQAVLQSASVHEVRYHEPDRALGGQIAALLRF